MITVTENQQRRLNHLCTANKVRAVGTTDSWSSWFTVGCPIPLPGGNGAVMVEVGDRRWRRTDPTMWHVIETDGTVKEFTQDGEPV